MPQRPRLFMLSIVLLCLLAALSFGGRTGSNGNSEPSRAAEGMTTASPQDDIRAALREIIEIRAEQSARARQLADSGRASFRDYAEVEVRFLEARIRLAVAEDRVEAAIDDARRIIAVRGDMLAQLMAGSERVDPDHVARARIDLAEAKIRLAGLEMAASDSP